MDNCVVVPVDDSARSMRACDVGKSLAQGLGLTLHLVSVVARASDADTRKAHVQRGLGDLDADVSVLVSDSPADAVLRFLAQGEGNVCCMSTHARNAVTEMVLGSVAQRIVTEYPGQVILVGPKHSDKWRSPIRSVLVCVDGSSLSEQAIAHGAAFAARMKIEFELIQVLKPEAAQLASSQDAAEWGYLRRTAERLNRELGIDAQWDVLHGADPATAIVDYADATPGALLVLTTHGRSGLSRITMGSVAQSVVHRSVGPVRVVRPNSD